MAAPRRRSTTAIPNLDLVRQLSETVAVSGDEGPIRRLVLEAIKPHVDSVTVDAMGSVLAVKAASKSPGGAGRRRRERVMIAAHMDEIGFMITGVDGEGALRFDVVGGVDDRQWIGKPVWIGPDRVPGVIAAAPMHLLNSERRSTVVRPASLRIDIGAPSEKQARSWVKVGQRGTFASTFSLIGSPRRPTTLRGLHIRPDRRLRARLHARCRSAAKRTRGREHALQHTRRRRPGPVRGGWPHRRRSTVARLSRADG